MIKFLIVTRWKCSLHYCLLPTSNLLLEISKVICFKSEHIHSRYYYKITILELSNVVASHVLFQFYFHATLFIVYAKKLGCFGVSQGNMGLQFHVSWSIVFHKVFQFQKNSWQSRFRADLLLLTESIWCFSGEIPTNVLQSISTYFDSTFLNILGQDISLSFRSSHLTFLYSFMLVAALLGTLLASQKIDKTSAEVQLSLEESYLGQCTYSGVDLI